MLVEVERLDPDRLPDLHALVRVADIAQSPFTQPPQGKVEEDVIGDERDYLDVRSQPRRGTHGVPAGVDAGGVA